MTALATGHKSNRSFAQSSSGSGEDSACVHQPALEVKRSECDTPENLLKLLVTFRELKAAASRHPEPGATSRHTALQRCNDIQGLWLTNPTHQHFTRCFTALAVVQYYYSTYNIAVGLVFLQCLSMHITVLSMGMHIKFFGATWTLAHNLSYFIYSSNF